MSGEIVGAKEPLTIDGQTGTPDPTPPKIDLANAEDVRREMARVYRGMKSKEIDPADGTKLVYVLSHIGKMIEIHEVEKRLTALEESANGKLLNAPR